MRVFGFHLPNFMNSVEENHKECIQRMQYYPSGLDANGSRADRQTIERLRSKESDRRPRQDCQYRDVRLHLIYNIENALPKESAFLFIAVSS